MYILKRHSLWWLCVGKCTSALTPLTLSSTLTLLAHRPRLGRKCQAAPTCQPIPYCPRPNPGKNSGSSHYICKYTSPKTLNPTGHSHGPWALTFSAKGGQAAAQDQISFSSLANENKVDRVERDRVERDSAAHKAASQSANSAPGMPAHIAPPAAQGTKVQASQRAGRLNTCRKILNTHTHTHVRGDKLSGTHTYKRTYVYIYRGGGERAVGGGEGDTRGMQAACRLRVSGMRLRPNPPQSLGIISVRFMCTCTHTHTNTLVSIILVGGNKSGVKSSQYVTSFFSLVT